MKTLIFSISLTVFFLCGAICAQWAEQTSGVTTALYSVQTLDTSGNVVWACGESGKILKTTNGGSNWTVYTLPPNPTLPLYTICGVNDQLCLVTGSNSTAAYIYKTSDGGANWTEVFNQTGGFINVIGYYVSINRFIFQGDPVGGRWTLFLSDNQGVTWDSTDFYLPQSGSEAGWNNSGSTSGAVVWFGTNNTRVYYYAAGFISQPTPGLTNSYAIWANDINNIMTGGTIMLFSSNGGNNWTNVNAVGTGNILGIGGIGTKWWYVRGSSVYYSSNNGTNWSTDYTSTGSYNDLAIAGNGNMWAVKSNGGISKFTAPVGIYPINSEVPLELAIYQNYPNPFNPVTKIKFDLPKSNLTLSGARGLFVKLIIYDNLGREIATLVNEQLQPGTYEVEWDARNYPSGVYYYKLLTNEYSESKKMILLK